MRRSLARVQIAVTPPRHPVVPFAAAASRFGVSEALFVGFFFFFLVLDWCVQAKTTVTDSISCFTWRWVSVDCCGDATPGYQLIAVK